MGGNSEVILSHTTNQLHFYKQLLQNFTLDRNISSKSGCGLINAVAFLGGDITSVHIKTITTFTTILTQKKIVCVEFVRPTLNHWIIQMQILSMNNVKLCPKTKTSNVSE